MLPFSYFKRENREMKLKATTTGGALVGENHGAHSWSGIRDGQSAAVMEHGQASPIKPSLLLSQKSCHQRKNENICVQKPTQHPGY